MFSKVLLGAYLAIVCGVTSYAFEISKISNLFGSIGRKASYLAKASCRIPPQQNGKFYTNNWLCHEGSDHPWCQMTPGSLVAHDWPLSHSCDPGFTLNGPDQVSTCTDGQWIPPIPGCIETVDANTIPSVPATALLTTERPSIIPPSTDCVIPNITENATKFCSVEGDCDRDCDFYNKRCHIPPGTRMGKGVWAVKVVCKEGYTHGNGSRGDLAVCHSAKWLTPITPCIKMCNPLRSEKLLLNCRYNNAIASCSSQYWRPGTWVRFRRKPGYSEIPDLKRRGDYQKHIKCKKNGEWSDTLPEYKTECGMSKNVRKFTPAIANGQEAHVGFFPWHAGLYIRKEKDGKVIWDHICGGTLITNRVILTAAHCVSGQNMSDIQVALGKYFRSWDVVEKTEEKRTISEIQIPQSYNEKGYSCDIALILLSEKINFGEYIMPACRDHDLSIAQLQKASRELHVVGWGRTGSNAAKSEILLHNTITAIPELQCRNRSPIIGTTDKFCAVKNNSESIVQPGDSGGGVTAVYADGRHYIVGVVNQKDQDYTGAQIAFFTNITFQMHFNWMQNQLNSWADD